MFLSPFVGLARLGLASHAAVPGDDDLPIRVQHHILHHILRHYTVNGAGNQPGLDPRLGKNPETQNPEP